MTAIQIEYGYLKAASRIMARHDLRFQLNGVQVQATEKETVLVATNGHMVLILRDDVENDVIEPTSLIIPASVVGEMTKKKNRHQKITLKSADCGRYKFRLLEHEESDAYLAFSPIDVANPPRDRGNSHWKFPNWKNVTPKKVSMEPCQYNPFYLATFEQAARDAGGTSLITNMTILQNGKGAGVVLHESNRNFLGLIMPITKKKQKIPGWVLAAANKEYEEAKSE